MTKKWSLIIELFLKIHTHKGFSLIGNNLPYIKNYCVVQWHRNRKLFSCVLAGGLLIRVYFETSIYLIAVFEVYSLTSPIFPKDGFYFSIMLFFV